MVVANHMDNRGQVKVQDTQVTEGDRMVAERFKYPILFAAVLMAAVFPVSAVAGVKASFIYTLSSFVGPIRCNWANLYVDLERNEIYLIDPREGDVRIFDENGMEIYRFGEDETLRTIIDLVVDGNGDILVLTSHRLKWKVVRCDYRGEPISEIEVKRLPSEFSDISPKRIFRRDGRLYLADIDAMKVAVIDANGSFERGYDIRPLLPEVDEKQRSEASIFGFDVDREGNMLFTVPVLFSAYVLSPDGNLTAFGTRGSGPGKFGVVGGIVSDKRGNVLVAETLRSVVMIFDREFRFQTEFGYRGLGPGNLIGPKNIAVDAGDRVYVSQLRNRGVSVFRITYN